MDPSNPMWPVGMSDLMTDANGIPQQQQTSPTGSQQQQEQQQQQQQINPAFMAGGSVFMGNGTPERNTMM